MDFHDIALLLRSHTPILVIETHEEPRAVDLLKDIALNQALAGVQVVGRRSACTASTWSWIRRYT